MEWVLISLQPYEYGLAVDAVREVLPAAALTPVPEESPWVLGLLNLRGELLKVIDLRLRVGLPAHSLDPESHLVVVEHAGRRLVLLVDRVEGVHALSALTERQDAESGARLVCGAGLYDSRPVLLINPGAL